MKIPNQSAPVLRKNMSNLEKISTAGIFSQRADFFEIEDEIDDAARRLNPRVRRRILRYLACRFIGGGSRTECAGL